MKIINVSDSVSVCQDERYYLVNSICINLEAELVFVDTGIEPIITRKFRNSMQKLYKQDKACLIITHANNDHFMGLKAFLDLPIIVSDKFMDPFNIRTKSSKIDFGKAFKPTEIYSSSKTFGSGKQSVTFTQTGGHTEDSCFGYYPAEKILIAGDNLLTDMPQYFFHTDSNLKKYINCLKEWEKMDIEMIIPGHGNITNNPSHISRVRSYFEKLAEFLLQAKHSDLSIEELLTLTALPKYFEPDPEKWIEKGIRHFYDNIDPNK
jgi:glyoxylase-like metal-dependent hydrolase (beta-lactamase superfamily II)